MADPKTAPKPPPPAKPELTEAALARIFDGLPCTLTGSKLVVVYPSLAEYGARAQDDMSALEELATVSESSLSIGAPSPAYAMAVEPAALAGSHVLTVHLS